jgi:acyl-coenzyme A thioesterase PaaI-like protein
MSTAFQDLMEHNFCFGCGAKNFNGLQIKSYWDGEESVCTFQPQRHHMAGPRHILNGGIIGVIIDCHCICTAIADAYKRDQREIGSTPMIWYATASMKVDYLRPTPINQPVQLRARVAEVADKKSTINCSLTSSDKECARAEVLAIRVPAEWFTG